MSLAELLHDYWGVIVANPLFFITTALVFSVLGFGAGKLLYGTVTNIVKERLEAARDDAARLEKAKREESETVVRLKDELDNCLQECQKTRRAPVHEPNQPVVNVESAQTVKVKMGGTGNIDSFFLSIPHRNLEDALKEARLKEKLVFAVIYDESHPKLSKLNYSLGYFMEYHTTKALVDEYFITAIVKSTNEKAAALVPEDDPLENCLWVVMTASGKLLRREGVYANPDVGLKRVREAIASAGKI